MKVALIHPSVSPVPGLTERLVAEQARLLRKSGHFVSVACFEGGESCEKDCFIPLSRGDSRKSLGLYLEAALAGSDAIIFHNIGTIPSAPELTAALRDLPRRLQGARWICWTHHLACLDASYLPFGSQEIAYWMSTPCPDWEYVAGGEACARQIRHAFGVDCTVIPSGLDCASALALCPAMDQFAADLRLWDKDLILLHPCPIQPRQGLENSLRILEQLRARSVKALILAGTPADAKPGVPSPYGAHLRGLRSAMQLEDSLLLWEEGGPFSPHLFPQWQRIADGVLLPSLTPPSEQLLWEFALAGLCVFTPGSGGLNFAGCAAYPAEHTPAQIAEWLIQQTSSRDAIQARRLARSQHRWPENHQKSLASLLEKPHN